MVALRLPFLQIRCLGSDRQCGIKGSVVHIPNDLDDTVTLLPRTVDDTQTIPVEFVRHMDHHKPYLFETVRPGMVWKAAEYLLTTPLYRAEGATLSEKWVADDDRIQSSWEMSGQKVQESVVSSNVLGNHDGFESQGEESMLINLDGYALRIAPGQGKQPLSTLTDPFAESAAYPTKWGGQFPPNLEELKIGFGEYKKFQIRSSDRRFTDPGTLLHFYSLVLKYHIVKSQSTYGRKKKGRKMTAGQMLDPVGLSNLLTHDYAFRLFKEVRTSPAYWEKKTKHVFALIRQIGVPNFFLTLSAAETQWPELLVVLKKVLDNEILTEDEAAALTSDEKSNLVRRDPVTCARYFEHRLHAAFNLLIKPCCGIFHPFGVTDFYIRTEFQHRGSPHAHMLLWLDGAPKFGPGKDSEVACVKLLDGLVSCKKDNVEIIHQDHNHNRTCRKLRGSHTSCRFNFPLPPMEETRILPPLPIATDRISYKKKFREIQDFLEMKKEKLEEMGFCDLLKEMKIEKKDYIPILQSSIKRTTVFLKRRPVDAFTNAYVPQLAKVWRSNMDLQMIFDPFGAAHYICSYITKSSGGLSKLMKEVSDQMKGDSISIKVKMQVIGKTFLNNVEVSAQEAAYGILGLPLTNASRDCVFIQTGPPEERVFLVKSEAELKNLDEDSTEIATSGALEHYVMRPECLENVCLADFSSWYTFSTKRRGKLAEKELDTESVGFEIEDETQKSPFLSLKDKSGYVKRRGKQRVIRYRRYGEIQDPLNYCRECLMLFIPWRDEQNELLEVDLLGKFQLHKQFIEEKVLEYNSLQKELQSTDIPDYEEDSDHELDEEYACMDGYNSKLSLLEDIFEERNQETFERIPVTHLEPFSEYRKKLERLNTKQVQFLCNLLRKLEAESVQRCFVYGGAGAGKSTLIDAIVQSVIRRELQQAGTSVDTCKVLLMAPTGMAAFNIKGTTIHSALKLPLSQFQGEMLPLAMGDRNTLACTLRDCKLIVIDEISMVSSTQLYHVSRRLQQIFSSAEDFGGKSIVVFGDLRQLPPVEAPYVFAPVNGFPNSLWESFGSYELTEIMRQKEDLKFAVALNNLARGTMTDEEVEMFRGREVSRIGYPEGKCRRLYYQNKRVDGYNVKVLAEMETKKAVSEAIDIVQGYGTEKAKNKLLEVVRGKPTKETSALPKTLHLVQSASYMLTRNLDTSDGLVNGAVGTLEDFSCGKLGTGGKIPTIAWIKYDRKEVGLKRRKTLKRLISRENACNAWTPILIEKIPVRCWKSSNLSCIRGQFPLIPAEGTTVHKSQGSTHDRILVNVEGLRRKALYVACSRAKTLSGLFLEGEFKPPKCTDADKCEVEMQLVRSRAICFEEFSDPVNFVLRKLSSADAASKEEGSCNGNPLNDVNLVENTEAVAKPKIRRIPTKSFPVPTKEVSKPILSIDGVNVHQVDLDSLRPEMWLTDGVVDGFFKLLQEKAEFLLARRLMVYTAPFVRVLENAENINDLVAGVNFEQQAVHQLVVFPLCKENHWTVAVANRENMQVRIYDSLSGEDSGRFLGLVVDFLCRSEGLAEGAWTVDNSVMEVPQQKNGYDCGVFVCYYVNNLSNMQPFGLEVPGTYRDFIHDCLLAGQIVEPEE